MLRFFSSPTHNETQLISHQAQIVFVIVDKLIKNQEYEQAHKQLDAFINSPKGTSTDKELAKEKVKEITSLIKSENDSFKPL
ncbi:MAG: hypothetical protein LEGION0398_MBIBDBAK_00661 [Legionellaceae bacterium]